MEEVGKLQQVGAAVGEGKEEDARGGQTRKGIRVVVHHGFQQSCCQRHKGRLPCQQHLCPRQHTRHADLIAEFTKLLPAQDMPCCA